MIFTSLACMQVGQALAARSDDRSLFALGHRTNPALLALVGVTILLQLPATYLP